MIWCYNHTTKRRDYWMTIKLAFCKYVLRERKGSEMNEYYFEPRNVLPNGLTLLQVNPDCAVQLDPSSRTFGWLHVRGADNQWVTHRKLSPGEIESAQDQASDCNVLYGTKGGPYCYLWYDAEDNINYAYFGDPDEVLDGDQMQPLYRLPN